MEKKLIEEWLKIDRDYGYCDGYCDGSGWGWGSGDGSGNDDGSGCGGGGGDGSGNGDGCGSGSGWGSGYCYGSGWGSGNGGGKGILKYKSYPIFYIDGVATIITHILRNVARGFVVNSDLTLTKTYVAKGNNSFAHGSTLREAVESLRKKIVANLNIDERIEEFKKRFNKKDKYLGSEFYEWHHLLTGSCLQGRNQFIKEKELSLEDSFTVNEFLEIVRGAYGWETLKELEKFYEKENHNQTTGKQQ